jgi:hypothetical protein
MLGLAGLGSIAGCSGRTEWVEEQLPGWARDRVDDSGPESRATSTSTPSPNSATPTEPGTVETSFTATHRETSERLRELANVEMDISFSHEPVEMSFEDSELIESLRAWSADGVEGDVVRVRPRDATGDDVAAVLEALWGVTGGASVSSTVGGTAYEFTGGETNASFSALVGLSETDSQPVFAVRAPDVGTAEEVARQLTGSDIGD